jgi:hypothetical protein
METAAAQRVQTDLVGFGDWVWIGAAVSHEWVVSGRVALKRLIGLRL